MNAEIVLASTSASRRAMLQAANVPFAVTAPNVDEDRLRHAWTAKGVSIPKIASGLAEAKAVEVGNRHTDAFVIGADQILECDGEIFVKAGDESQARATLMRLKGREHRLISAAAIVRRGAVVSLISDEARLTMRNFSDAFLDNYISAEMPDILGSVGCYRIEGMGAQLFSSVSGDQFSIRGLPLLRVLQVLREQGALPS